MQHESCSKPPTSRSCPTDAWNGHPSHTPVLQQPAVAPHTRRTHLQALGDGGCLDECKLPQCEQVSGQGAAGAGATASKLLPTLLHELQAPERSEERSGGRVGCERKGDRFTAGGQLVAPMRLSTCASTLQQILKHTLALARLSDLCVRMTSKFFYIHTLKAYTLMYTPSPCGHDRV